MPRVYFDNAATTPLCDEAKEAMIHVIDHIHGNPSSIHADGRAARAIIEKSRKTVASIINSSVSEIFFTSGGTESNNMVLIGCVRDLGVKRIISSPVEHHCILHTLDYLKTHSNVEILFLPVNRYGAPDLEVLDAELKKSSDLTLVTLMHVNNELGTITDISEAAKICKENSAIFHTDTTQSIGLIPIDIQKQGIDFLTGSAHKFHGPKGVGFVYISNNYPIQSYIHGGSQERNMRAGTENLIGIAGMAAALESTWAEHQDIYKITNELRNQLKNGILDIFDKAYINGDPNNYSPKILSVSFPPSDKNEMVLLSLDIHGISASGGSACSSGVEHASGVLEHINEPSDRKTIRFSFSKYNTMEEIETCLEKLRQIYDIKKHIFMKIALIGYGKMGKAIEELALEAGDEIILKVDVHSEANWHEKLKEADVAIEFTNPHSAFSNLKICIDYGIPVVCGSTGWYESKKLIEDYCIEKNGTMLIASNFSIGVNIFFKINEYLAEIMAQYPEYKVSMEEIHHTAKLDQPSGTAITLAESILEQRHDIGQWTQNKNLSESHLYIESIRQDPAPGTHKIFYGSPIDSIEITHTAHSRKGFAAGALLAAKWIIEKKGVFSMKNII